jgi:molecular chaperone HtpG
LASLDKLPQTEAARERGYDILYLTDDIDEFVIRALDKQDEKEFRSVTSGDLGLQSDDEEKATEKAEKKNSKLLDFVKETLDGKIAAVKLSRKLKTAPVCLTAQGDVTLEMEKYFSQNKNNDMMGEVKAERVLELNAAHSAFGALRSAFDADRDRAKKYAELLYGQALILAGLLPDDAAGFAALVCELM